MRVWELQMWCERGYMNYWDERELTINGLSMLVGVTQSTANDFLKGTSSNIVIILLKKLIDGLDMTITEFFDSDLFRNPNQKIQ